MHNKALVLATPLAIVLLLLLLAAGCAPAPEPVPPGEAPALVATPEEEVHKWVAVGIHTPGELAHSFEQELATKVVNMDSWNALSPDLQRIVELAAKHYSRMRAMHHEALDHEHLQKMKDFGVEVIQWTPEEIARGMEYSRGTWEGFAVDDLSRRVLESQKAYMRTIGLIE